MNRILPFLIAAFLFSGVVPSLSWAQQTSAPDGRWGLGVHALRVTSHDQSTTEVGLHASRRVEAHWGLRASVYHAFFEASPLTGFGATYDRRQTGGTIALFWEPMQFQTGALGHALRAHAGPMVQVRRATRRSVGICATGLSTDDVESVVDRHFPKHTRDLESGVAFGLGYELSYEAVAARVIVRTRNAGFERTGWTSGVGLTLTVRF